WPEHEVEIHRTARPLGRHRNLSRVSRLYLECEGGFFPNISGKEDMDVDVPNRRGRVLDKGDGKPQPIECDREFATGKDESIAINADQTELSADLVANVVAKR